MIDYRKKRLNPGDYKVILDHCKEGYSFASVASKIHMSQRWFYAAIKGDKLIEDIRLIWCGKNKHRRKDR